MTMLNINAGHNKELLENCHILGEYAQYVDRVRKYATQMDLNHAVERAITECIQEGILAEFLQRNRAEVFKVSIFEYDKEKEEKKLRKAEYEHGLEDGKTEGISIERENMLTLLERMTAGGDGDKVAQLRNPEVLENMKKKYGVE